MAALSQQDEFRGLRVAFVSTRIAGKDGVSLEIEKWAAVLERLGVECFYIAGECDRPAGRSAIIDPAHFRHPQIAAITTRAFGHSGGRPAELTAEIFARAKSIRDQLNQALTGFNVDVVIAENALTIPMNIPLGIALVWSLEENNLGCIAHHHDFYWERERYLDSVVDDLLRYAFPPALSRIQHVVINQMAAEEFSRRTGLYCRIIPNVMDFATPPPPPDDYARSLRSQLGMGEQDLLVLQPTRVVARKGIEHSVELVRRLKGRGAKLVISHASGDEGQAYAHFLDLFSGAIGVPLVFADRWLRDRRGTGADGTRFFTLADFYSQADLVAYPSEYEGFGNAFLEAVYYRKPIFCKRYAVFRTDIEPCGFQTVAFDDYVTRDVVAAVEAMLARSDLDDLLEHNYRTARRYFSYEVLEEELRPLLRRAFLASRSR
ncbi:MAG TPA: glycosyltransferase [Sedimenticola sp.]|nr:glycosyltransferase [Sedimenticola sp.]